MRRFTHAATVFLALAAALPALGQANLPLYTDNLVNNFQDWSWLSRDLANTSPVHTGTRSISCTGVAGQALSLEHPDFSTAPYASLTFWAHGGATGGQRLQVYAQYGSSSAPAYSLPTALTAGTWTQYTITLSTLGVANRSNVNRFNFQLKNTGTTNTFYIDDVQVNAAAAPALVHLTADAGASIRGVEPRWFGLNTAIWDSNFDTTATSNALRELGTRILRFPGGSLSDEYHWATGKSLSNTWAWVTSFGNFMHVATNAGVQAYITVNYGSGTSNEAAAWVRAANITNHCNFKYWEIGNECYGSWERDTNLPVHDPYTYATRAANYIALMKAADSNILVGVVVTTGEDSYSNNATHFAVNPRTAIKHYGWTPIVLDTLHSLGVTPDYVVHHVYPQWTGPESDPLVLQTAADWASDAADLRQQLTDYLGASGSNVELVCTENNSNSGAQGRQSTSVVNALYLADSLSQLMKTEFNAYVWWDLRNGSDTSGSFDPTLYGWRSNGDLGIMLGTTTKYPTYYAYKLMQYFVQPGDTVLGASSDYLLLSAYASRAANGALNLLVLNKDVTTAFNAQISLANFQSSPGAVVRSFGIAQDEATRLNDLTPGAQDLYTNSVSVADVFTSSFPAGTLTLFTIPPVAPALHAVSTDGASFVYQIEGQPGTPYVVSRTADLTSGVWTAVATNKLSSDVEQYTNSVAGDTQFFRAEWRP